MSPLSTAQQLPVEVIARIFLHTLFDDDQDGWENGNELVGWDSSSGAAPLALVCKAWYAPATALLYDSVDIRGSRAALGFLTTTRKRPELLKLLSSLVVGLGRLEDVADGSLGHVPASFVIMEVLESCSIVDQLVQLQIRPLHVAVGPRLAAFLARVKPRALVMSDRVVRPSPPWCHGLFDAVSWAEVLQRAERYDLDWDMEAVPLPLPVALPTLRLQHCSLRVSAEPEVFYHFYGALSGAHMRILRVYAEQTFPPKTLASSLAHLTRLRHLRYLCNPPLDHSPPLDPVLNPPLIDLLLPYLRRLETLDVSATEMTTRIFSDLPHTLRSVKINVFTPNGFAYTSSMADGLRNSPHSLEELVIVDSRARWATSDVEELDKACEERGIRFVFINDDLRAADFPTTSDEESASASEGFSDEEAVVRRD
ncbi:hypothetical protein BCR35DRAFT_108026 [Leucosporidium creatinivorum]|uniref:Uncharacterized protein n=1 Tax=Leucosporidium creatinivorum TaxID=106004 RepID=A0A1Y2G3E0_9BASI|nr:hypothetical protein BCR35DRAFT_108026 [Leucosporidium creatinivorum]